MRKYLVDSNFFIQAHRAYYPLDIVGSFWKKVSDLASRNIIISIDKVRKEIFDDSSHEDELKTWCNQNLSKAFFKDSSNVINNYISIAEWANSMSNHYTTNAIQEFLQTDLADPWLVAYAIHNELTIVTYEKSEPNRKTKIKIPEVCKQFNVKYLNTIEMLRQLNENF